MIRLFIVFITCVLFVVSPNAGAQPEIKMTNLSALQIDSLLTDVSQRNMTVTERMKYFSGMFLDMPYNIICAGDGPYALYETYPLVNFQETNCMVFCEHVLALSISDSWDNFFNNLQQIRYKDGIIGMRTRNHYTIADWLPQNSWLLNDVSQAVGGELAKKVTRNISHSEFFKGKGINDMRYVLPDREITVSYIPKESLAEIQSNLRNGDIGALLFADKTDIFSAHMWMVIDRDGELVIRESSNSKMSTFDTSYDTWSKKIAASKRYIGIAVMRVRDEVNQPGMIILPWEINDMKK